LTFVELYYLARVIHPFGHERLKHTDIGDEYVMWFSESVGPKFPGAPSQYRKRIRGLNDGKIGSNLEEAYYVVLQIIAEKYTYLRYAVWLLFVIMACAIFVGVSSLLTGSTESGSGILMVLRSVW
jgi:hypothetical protein